MLYILAGYSALTVKKAEIDARVGAGVGFDIPPARMPIGRQVDIDVFSNLMIWISPPSVSSNTWGLVLLVSMVKVLAL